MSEVEAGGEASVLNVYEALGGQPFFDDLVERFYRRVAMDPLLRPLYPDDLAGPRRHLALFLGQYWGGPTTYSDERGHPALRMRHMRFHIGPRERDRWLEHMASAVAQVCDDPAIAADLMRYFVSAAEHLRNDTGLPISSAGYPR